ncbi:hypothetical protein SDC9_113821 [bioreactor metagenome]|uniref:Uncharacterized protein n=1 Tax=bioreactor metagenome TaxID=1076179 RepID=A0A645BP61_9ZZZZ
MTTTSGPASGLNLMLSVHRIAAATRSCHEPASSLRPHDWVQAPLVRWPRGDPRVTHDRQDGGPADAEPTGRLSARVPLAVVVHERCAFLGTQPPIDLERDVAMTREGLVPRHVVLQPRR